MTKKHFEWAAAYVRRYRNEIGMTRGMTCVSEDAFADLFTRFGPRFDEGRFRAACRGGEAAAVERGYEVRS
jgi:hypothetical protein